MSARAVTMGKPACCADLSATITPLHSPRSANASSQAERLDPKAVWYSYGTVRMAETYAEPGILDRLEIVP